MTYTTINTEDDIHNSSTTQMRFSTLGGQYKQQLNLTLSGRYTTSVKVSLCSLMLTSVNFNIILNTSVIWDKQGNLVARDLPPTRRKKLNEKEVFKKKKFIPRIFFLEMLEIA